jgi:hypothetical protein
MDEKSGEPSVDMKEKSEERVDSFNNHTNRQQDNNFKKDSESEGERREKDTTENGFSETLRYGENKTIGEEVRDLNEDGNVEGEDET